MNDAEFYRARAAALLVAAQESPNHFLRPEYEYIASVYLRLAEQAFDRNSMGDGKAGTGPITTTRQQETMSGRIAAVTFAALVALLTIAAKPLWQGAQALFSADSQTLQASKPADRLTANNAPMNTPATKITVGSAAQHSAKEEFKVHCKPTEFTDAHGVVYLKYAHPVCTENLTRVDEVRESPNLKR